MWPGMPPHSSMFHTSFHTSPKSIRIRVSNCDKLRTERKALNWISLSLIFTEYHLRDFRSSQCHHQLPQLWQCTQPSVVFVCNDGRMGLQWFTDVYSLQQNFEGSNPCRSILMRLAFFATFGLIRFNWRAGHVHSLWHLTHHFRCMPAPSLFSGSAQMLVEQVERRQCFIRSPFAEWQADGFDIAKHRDKDVHLFLN
jgi:hypothetical protein